MVQIGITAAAARITMPRDQIGRRSVGWQADLWQIYRGLGPVHYGIGFKRNSAYKVTYFAAEIDEDQDEPEPTENPRVLEVFDQLGAVEDLVSEFVVHENVVGEGYLVGQDRDGLEWEVWSNTELAYASGAGQKRHADDIEPLQDDDVVIRIWRPDPENHYLPDSPLRSVQAQCDQLLLLNDQIGAVAQSRLSAGILLVPNELSFARAATEPPGTGANADDDPFMAEIIDIMTLPISDARSAARVAPAVIRGKAEFLESIKHLTFGRDIDATFAEMREELLRQIAAGLDLPPEIVLGKADLNHWSAWDVDDSAAKLHVDPDVLHVLDGITMGYLQPMLVERGMSPDEAENFVIWRDYSDLTSRPLSIDHAIELYELGVVSDGYVRRVANVPDDDAGDGVVKSRTQSNAPASGDNVDRSPPAVTAAAGIYLGDLGDIDGGLALRIVEASESAAERAIERAGAKIRAKAKKDRQATAAINNISNPEVARTLGQAQVEKLQLTNDQLVPADSFAGLSDRLLKMLERSWGQARARIERLTGAEVEDREADDRERAVSTFIAALLGLVAARLFTAGPDPDPAETGEIAEGITTGQMVYDLLTTAGGGGTGPFTPETPRGMALGERTRSILADHGYLTTSETWVYGVAPRQTFQPHLSLDGEVNPQVPGPSWLGVQFMYPGDHKGCLCRLVPTVEQVT